MTIREATASDTEAIRSIAETSWNEDYPDIVSRETIEEGFDEWYGTDRLEMELARPMALVLVAEEDGIVGFVHAIVDGDDGVIMRLYVHPDHRGEGIGRDLFRHVRSALQRYDIERIRAMVLAENTLGNQFYRRLGFEMVSEDETTIGGENFAENLYELHET